MAFVRKPIPDFSPPANLPARASLNSRPLPATPGPEQPPSQASRRDDRSADRSANNDPYSELGGYERMPTYRPAANERRGDQSNGDAGSGWYNRELNGSPPHRLQASYRDRDRNRDRGRDPVRRDSSPDRDPLNYHHNPPHYKQGGPVRKKKLGNPLTCCSNAIVSSLEEAFYRLGYGVAKLPSIPIILGLLVFVAAGSGMYVYRSSPELDGDKLWVPAEVPAHPASRIVNNYFPTNSTRVNRLIITAKSGNVLTPTAFKAMADLHENIMKINEDQADGKFDALCVKQGTRCLLHGLLELWQFNLPNIRALTQDDILLQVNSPTATYDITNYIGKIKRNGLGDITEAGAVIMHYELRHDLEKLAEDWETGFLDVAQKGHVDLTVFRYAARSHTDEGLGVTVADIVFLGSGFAVFVLFVVIMLGRINRVEHKVFVAVSGILCIVMALGITLGLGSYAQLVYSPVHIILPFLLLGVGVDDMFVIVGALENLRPSQKKLPVPERIGLALKSAGVSILATSLTSMLIFGISISITVPALRSLCTCCLIGTLATFVFMCTWFTAWLAVDARRADSHRDACACFLLLRWFPNGCSRTRYLKVFFREVWARAITHIAGKVLVVLVTAGLLAGGIYGTIYLQRGSTRDLFLPKSSYTQAYLREFREFFLSQTETIQTKVYLIDVDYFANYSTLETLQVDLKANHYTQPGTVLSWCIAYRDWLKVTTISAVTSKLDTEKYPRMEADFYDILVHHFLPTTEGAGYTQDIVLSTSMDKVTASRYTLHQYKLTNTTQEIKAMDSIREIVKKTGFSEENAFPYAPQYMSYEGNKWSLPELYRTLGLAFLCVVVMMLLLLASIPLSFFIFLCVTATIVDIGGMMYFWGLSIDPVTSASLLVVVAFSIDYVTHVCRTFMTVQGSRGELVRRSLSLTGPAVFLGGFATFLAFISLIFSTSYILKTFTKVFLGALIFGLFHGLAFLPVLLSLVGPGPYASADRQAYPPEGEDDARAPWDDTDRFDERRDRRLSQWAQRSNHLNFHESRKHSRVREEQAQDPRLYVPRGTAFDSRIYRSQGTSYPARLYPPERRQDRRVSSHSVPTYINGGNGRSGMYTKPMGYRKPQSYIKPLGPGDVFHVSSHGY